jgi:pentatricopeptide repeat protein
MQKAQQEFMKMLEANIKPDIVTCSILATGFGRSGLLMEVLDFINLNHMMDEGLEPTSLIYGVAIDSLCKQGNLSEAENLFYIVEEKGIDKVEALHSAMVCGYLNSGWTDDAYMLFLRVAQQGSLVDHFSCSKLINDLCRGGNVKGASDVLSMMLKKMLFLM